MNDLSLDERTALILSEENLTTKVFNHIACGGSLLSYCQVLGIPFYKMVQHVRRTPGFKELVAEAEEFRKDWERTSILDELKRLALIDLRKIFNDDHSLKPVSEWPDDVARAVSAIDVQETKEDGVVIGHVKKVKFLDKHKALIDLGKSLGLFTEKHAIEHRVTLEDLIMKSHKLEEK